MLVAGVDVGARNISVVVLEDERVVSSSVSVLGDDVSAASGRAVEETLAKTGLSFADLKNVVATGCGKDSVPFASFRSSDVVCQARGAFFLFPSVGTVINLGAESSRVMRVGKTGRAESFAKNDRCAAGSGMFLEMMSKLLAVPVAEMGELSLMADGIEEVSSICAVFAESEVISHVHRGVPRDRILAGIHRAVAERIMEVAGKVGIRADVVVTGGVARNRAVIGELERRTRQTVLVPAEPQITGALGAALIARDKGGHL